MRRLLNTENDIALTIARLVLGIVIVAHGAQKLFGSFGGAGYADTITYLNGLGVPTALASVAIVAEFVGGVALVLGLLTRIAGLGVACLTVATATTQHWTNGFFMNWNGTQAGEGVEFSLLVIGLALVTTIRGAGALSVDRLAVTTEATATTATGTTTVGQAVVQEREETAVKKSP